MSLRLQTQQLCFRIAVGDMPLEARVPAMQARFQDMGSSVITRNPMRLRAFVLSQPRGRQTSRRHKGSDVSRASIAPCDHMASHDNSRVCTTDCLLLECDCATHCDVVHAGQAERPNELMLSTAPREARGGGCMRK